MIFIITVSIISSVWPDLLRVTMVTKDEAGVPPLCCTLDSPSFIYISLGMYQYCVILYILCCRSVHVTSIAAVCPGGDPSSEALPEDSSTFLSPAHGVVPRFNGGTKNRGCYPVQIVLYR